MAHRHLRAWRERAGLTLEQVAEKLDVTHSAVQKWERGQVPVTLPRLQELAPLYGAQPFELLFPPAEREQAATLAQAWEILRQLPPDQAAAWLLTGRTMAGMASPAAPAEPGKAA